MAHPKRKRMVAKLMPRVDAPVKVVWDERNNVWHTGRRALLAYDPEASHHLVLQDDAVIPRRLVATCTQLLEHVPPDAPVALYMGRWRYRPFRFSMEIVTHTAQQRGAAFAVFPGPWWGVGIILPTKHIEDVVAFGDKSSHTNYDIRIAQYFDHLGVHCWYTMPSLVDHQAGESLVGRRGRGRHAQWHASPTGIDWSAGHITPADMGVVGFPVTPW